MSVSTARPTGFSPMKSLHRVQIRSGVVFGVIILMALVAFEVFNYSTTDYALRDLLGNLRFAGIRWSTILALAFCGIDFAGIARLFTPENNKGEEKEAWYLFGAWLLAATMNAILTWWGISMAMTTHTLSSTAVVSASTLTNVVPVFVAIMVWVIRILIIGSLSVASERLIGNGQKVNSPSSNRNMATPLRDGEVRNMPIHASGLSPRPMTRSNNGVTLRPLNRTEPSYHNVKTEAAKNSSQSRYL